MRLAAGHFFANEHFVAIMPDFATKVALESVFCVGERSSPTAKHTLFWRLQPDGAAEAANA